MPTTYAHLSFGQRVLAMLNPDTRELAQRELTLFHIGLHGPDILFYHQPLGGDRVTKVGYHTHAEPGRVFFEEARQVLSKPTTRAAALSYAIGVLCHYILDSECHPLVREMESSTLYHNQIETAFDRQLMERDGLNPLSYRPTNHLWTNPAQDRIIAMFYKGINDQEIGESVRRMRRNLNLLVSPGWGKRKLLIGALKLSGHYDSLKGLLMERVPDARHLQHNLMLTEAYEHAIPIAVDQIERYLKSLDDGTPLNQRLDPDFG